MDTLSWVGDTTCVAARDAPFHWIFEPSTKLLPVTARVTPGEPVSTADGESMFSTGTGLEAEPTVKVRLFEVPPPGAGFMTVMVAVLGEEKVDA